VPGPARVLRDHDRLRSAVDNIAYAPADVLDHTYRSASASALEYDTDHNFKLNLWSYDYPRFAKPFYYGLIGVYTKEPGVTVAQPSYR
jgi:hypothetical protein